MDYPVWLSPFRPALNAQRSNYSALPDRPGWTLEIQPPFPLSYNYVAPAVRADGTHVVLKLGVPNAELLSEIAALSLFAGHGATRLLESDPEMGALLLERLEPGEPLSRLEDNAQEVSIAAEVMPQLWRAAPADGPIPSLARWTAALEKLRPHFGGAAAPSLQPWSIKP